MTSSQPAVEQNLFQQIEKRSARAGSALMTSAVTSQSAGIYSRCSRWMIQTQKMKRRRTGRSIQSQYNQQLVFEVSDSKTMSFGLIDTTAFCLHAKIQQMVLR
ncbi:hypothetical protein F511_29513 [Dorcoceras hygrometricum]|uniref:Uncharacterized protein n=1 Tax=Dorcoceras hygrometricum TaxID=472368 RepID=A0A2Z7CRL9_9LAMI|nr:hypothetical protein F511_29513 [Dorcoceras hygrometricum]